MSCKFYSTKNFIEKRINIFFQRTGGLFQRMVIGVSYDRLVIKTLCLCVKQTLMNSPSLSPPLIEIPAPLVEILQLYWPKYPILRIDNQNNIHVNK